MLRLFLIRHSMTAGNAKRRYIGVTDEPLCPEGVSLLQKARYPRAEAVFSSPLRRCLQTAKILYPRLEPQVIDQLSECDFGEFENKNYQELSGNPRYREWVNSGGSLPFPGGENRETFRRRSLQGFDRAVQACLCGNIPSAALIVHGGTIMNIMEAYVRPYRPFYDWHIGNGCGYTVELDPSLWKGAKGELRLIGRLPGERETK